MSFSSSLPREYISQMMSKESAELSDIDEDDVLSTNESTVITLPSMANKSPQHDDQDDDIFAMDEENVDRKKNNSLSTKRVGESDDEEDDKYMRGGSRAYSVSGRVANNMNGGFDSNYRSNAIETTENGIGPLTYGSSLPITIPGRFWPPEDATDSFDPDENGGQRQAITIYHQREQDLYSVMRDQARSIQAPDNPERLFGERPRRRHQTGENPSPVPFLTTGNDGNSPPAISASVAR
ncbi:hypothetical protein QR680_001712 [Steinernema hermaphroditum]|uniref:Uncharacterized protein n=1 Tax=Steinernema hermaphroditum TaxID=289476 RepID=A0AA39H178_9BILA|nr:hypothetical protein QR680_001712 [Steinernema hermaphroditum]